MNETIVTLIVISVISFLIGMGMGGILERKMMNKTLLDKGLAHYNPTNGNFELNKYDSP